MYDQDELVDQFAMACAEDPPLAETMLQNRPELVRERNRRGESALLQVISIYHGLCTETVKFLIQKGADANAATDEGDTPLHMAVREGTLEVVRLLLEAGANVNARDEVGSTPLHGLDESTNIAIVDSLLSEGADALIVDENGEGLLHVAARFGRLDVIERGVKFGLNPAQVSSTGATPHDIAVVHRQWDAMQYLREY